MQSRTALRYAAQILAALTEAHEKGIIHRDLKPGNIMIAKSGVKVLDFGLAKSEQDDSLTASHVVMGTPAYMAPEQREGKPADARTDIYSFGCVLYEMLTGARVTFQRKRIASRKLERIVNRCLEDDPARRWQSAAELGQELSERQPRQSAGNARPRPSPGPLLLTARPNSRTKARLFWQISRMQLATLPSMARCARSWQCNWRIRPSLSLLPDARVTQTLGFMGRRANAKLTPNVAAEICERTASSAVVEGSITSLGNEYLLTLRARNCRTGETLDQEQKAQQKKRTCSRR